MASFEGQLLCESCHSLLELLARSRPARPDTLTSRPNGIFLAELSSAGEISPLSDCSLCRLLFLAKVDPSKVSTDRPSWTNFQEAISAMPIDNPGIHSHHSQTLLPSCDGKDTTISYEVRALSFLRFTHALSLSKAPSNHGLGDTMVLAVVPTGTDCHARSEVLKSHFWANGHVTCQWGSKLARNSFIPRRLASGFDTQVAKRVLDYCKTHHQGCLNIPASSIRGLRLIDCASGIVVAAPPGALYTALSYVWGFAEKESLEVYAARHDATSGIPHNLPPVISDAISLTRELGFQYLWVDRYCINQRDPGEMHVQINQMDLIYQTSELTIVAAAGTDENTGLPGVRQQRRNRQMAVSAGDLTLLSTLPHTHDAIKKSKWFTRGWTFQESVLSRRVLAFSEDQIYFECKSMNCSEVLDSPLDKLHTTSKRHFRSFVRAGLFTGRDEGLQEGAIFGVPFGRFNEVGHGWSYHFRKFLVLVTSYTSRGLTFDSDSIRAFSGVLRNMELAECSIGHVLGIPYISLSSQPSSKIADCVVAGLCWRHLAGCWSEGIKPRRRDGFPSWSWAGWAGSVSWTDLFTHDNMDIVSLVDDLCCELSDGTLLSLPEYARLRLSHDGELTDVKALRFSAWLCPPDMFSLTESPSRLCWGIEGFEWELHLSHFGGSPQGFLEALKSGVAQCIYVGKGMYNSYFLLLDSQGDSARRIGTAEAQWNQYRGDGPVVNELFAEQVKFESPKLNVRLV